MNTVFNIALHSLLAGSLLLFVCSLVASTVTEVDAREKILRIAALLAGAMIALGAQASGVDYASFAVDALAGARPASTAAKLFSTVVPAAMGIGVGFLLVRMFRKSDRLAMRLMGFVGMLATTAFLALYAQTLNTNGVVLGAAAIPNVAFSVGVLLTIIFTDNPDGDSSFGNFQSLLHHLPWVRGTTQNGVAPSAQKLTPIKKDPFS